MPMMYIKFNLCKFLNFSVDSLPRRALNYAFSDLVYRRNRRHQIITNVFIKFVKKNKRAKAQFTNSVNGKGIMHKKKNDESSLA